MPFLQTLRKVIRPEGAIILVTVRSKVVDVQERLFLSDHKCDETKEKPSLQNLVLSPHSLRGADFLELVVFSDPPITLFGEALKL
jgi:hypothetical protein